MRIIFFGTPRFAIPSLQALLVSNKEVVAVVTQTDKRKGRSGIPSPPPVKELAVSKGLPVLQPEKLKDPAFIEKILSFQPDLIVVVAYGKILPPQILDIPKHGCVNVHASLLPKYRGAAPVQWAIIKGEKETGVTTMLMNEGLDTGDILMQEAVEIKDTDNAETLAIRLSEKGASLLLKTVERIESSSIKPVPQKEEASYAPPLRKENGKIDWAKNAFEIWNFVRGMYPWPGAYCILNRERLRIIRAAPLQGNGVPGRVEDASGRFIIGAGKGIVEILELQPEGKRIMNSRDFVIGRRLKEGVLLDDI